MLNIWNEKKKILTTVLRGIWYSGNVVGGWFSCILRFFVNYSFSQLFISKRIKKWKTQLNQTEKKNGRSALLIDKIIFHTRGRGLSAMKSPENSYGRSLKISVTLHLQSNTCTHFCINDWPCCSLHEVCSQVHLAKLSFSFIRKDK